MRVVHRDFPNIEKSTFFKLITNMEAMAPSDADRCLWPKGYNEFTAECCYKFIMELRTYDEASNSVRPFPTAPYIREYVEHLIEAYVLGLPFEVEKSRRLVFSWTACAFDLWLMGLKGNVKGLVIALTHEKASDFVWRILHLYRDLQKTRADWDLPDCRAFGSLARKMAESVVLSNGSQMGKYHESPQGIQGAGYTLVHIEELSQFRNPSSVWSQAMFITQGEAGGRGGFVHALTNVSTSQDHLINVKRGLKFQEVLEFDEKGRPGVPTKSVKLDGYVYYAVHYSADPAKDAKWVKGKKAEVSPDDWEREMEGNELIYGGQPVYAGVWKRQAHEYDPCFIWTEDHYWLAGLDGGNTMNPAIVLVRGQNYPFQVRTEAEIFVEGGSSMEQLLPLYIAKCVELGLNPLSLPMYADPALWARQGAKGESSADICSKYGIPIYRSTNDWLKRKGAVDWCLTQSYEKGPEKHLRYRMTINKATCPVLSKGFYGQYRYEEHARSDIGAGQVLLKPLKNMYSHLQDALQYACIEVRMRFDGYDKVRPTSWAPARKGRKDAFDEF
jgi:hypothetical protein